MSRMSRVRGAANDIFYASRRVVDPIIYLPSFTKPSRKPFVRSDGRDITRQVENMAYPSGDKGRRGLYPCRGSDLATALYDCRERHVHVLGCINPYVLGEILADGGFEDGGGGSGNEIPRIKSDGSGYIWDDDSVAPDQDIFAMQDSDDATYLVETTDPRTGTYHLRFQDPDGSTTDVTHVEVWLIKDELCSSGRPTKFDRHYSAIVEPGDTVTFSCYAKATNLSGTPQIRLEYYVFDESADDFFDYLEYVFSEDPGSGSGELELTSSYELYSISSVMPAGAHYIQVSFWFQIARSGPTYYDADDFSLDIS